MRRPKTLKSYIKYLQLLEGIPLKDLRGYDKLNDEQKSELGALTGEIANAIFSNDFRSIIENANPKKRYEHRD